MWNLILTAALLFCSYMIFIAFKKDDNEDWGDFNE